MPDISCTKYAAVNKIDKNPCPHEAHIHFGKEWTGMLGASFGGREEQDGRDRGKLYLFLHLYK